MRWIATLALLAAACTKAPAPPPAPTQASSPGTAPAGAAPAGEALPGSEATGADALPAGPGATGTCSTDADCRPTGCSGTLCSSQEVITTCEHRPEQDCFRAPTTTCGCFEGRCAWTPTEELRECLRKLKR